MATTDDELEPSGMDTNAVNKVINTVELLDSILQHLPPKKVFVLQRINKAFQTHIRGDPQIATKLHLTPRQPGERRLYPALIEKPAENWLGPIEMETDDATRRWKLFGVSKIVDGRATHCSWEDMLLMQPPICEMKIYDVSPKTHRGVCRASLSRLPGLTLGSIYRTAQEALQTRAVQIDGVSIESAVVYFRCGRIEIDCSANWTENWTQKEFDDSNVDGEVSIVWERS